MNDGRTWFGPILPGYTITLDDSNIVVKHVPDRPCPDVLTAEEAVQYLRLDDTDIADPERTLHYYRKYHGLRGTQVGKKVRYLRIELEALLERLTEENPR